MTPPNVPWSSYNCQVVGEGIYYWPQISSALQILDAWNGRLSSIELDVAPGYQYGNFLVSPGRDWIAWSVGQTDEASSQSTLYLTRGDGSEQRKVLDERYDDLRHIWPVAWGPAGDVLFFSRQSLIEGNGAILPAFQGRYSNLYRLSIETGEINKILPPGEQPDCGFCVADVSLDGHWLAYHHEDGTLYLRDLYSGDESYVSGGNGNWVAGARFSPDGSHLAYVEVKERDQPRFAGGRTVVADVPPTGSRVIVSECSDAVDWPVGWLDGETPVLERLDAEGHRGLWVANESSEPGILLPGILVGVVYAHGNTFP